MCYIYRCSYGTRDTYKSTFSTYKFIFTVIMKIRVKPSVFVSSGYFIWAASYMLNRSTIQRRRCSGSLQWLNGHPRLVAVPFCLLKVIVAWLLTGKLWYMYLLTYTYTQTHITPLFSLLKQSDIFLATAILYTCTCIIYPW